MLKYYPSAVNRFSLFAIQSGGDRPPLFCIHPMGGRIHWYHELAQHLGKDQPVYGLQAQGLEDLRPLHTNIDSMASHYVAEIKSFLSDGPYYLVGYSFGGVVAFEMARQLENSGGEVALLALLDTHGPGYSTRLATAKLIAQESEDFDYKINRHLRALSRLQAAEQIYYLGSRLLNCCRNSVRQNGVQMRKSLSKSALKLSQTFGFPLPLAFRDFKSIHRQIHRKHKSVCAETTRVFTGRVALLRAIDQGKGLSPDRTIGWANFLTGQLTIHDVPGDHASIITEPNVRTVAQTLRACVDDEVHARSNRPAASSSFSFESLRRIA